VSPLLRAEGGELEKRAGAWGLWVPYVTVRLSKVDESGDLCYTIYQNDIYLHVAAPRYPREHLSDPDDHMSHQPRLAWSVAKL
jgi:hypothetical protein